jgi:PhoPQ-activated pathogenicity-related protein
MKLFELWVAAWVAILSSVLCVTTSAKGLTQSQRCYGTDCNGKDPMNYRCNADARIVEKATKTVSRWQDKWSPRRIVIQHMYSKGCHASWTQAYVPSHTFLYVKEQSDSRQSTSRLKKATGTGYFWAHSTMSGGDRITQACVALPVFSNPNGYDLYDRHCTNFKQK